MILTWKEYAYFASAALVLGQLTTASKQCSKKLLSMLKNALSAKNQFLTIKIALTIPLLK